MPFSKIFSIVCLDALNFLSTNPVLVCIYDVPYNKLEVSNCSSFQMSFKLGRRLNPSLLLMKNNFAFHTVSKLLLSHLHLHVLLNWWPGRYYAPQNTIIYKSFDTTR